MTNPPRKLSVDIIDRAPEQPAGGQGDGDVLENYEALIADLQAELASTQAEYVALKQQNDLDTVRANLMRPYANKVFCFLVGYCVVIGLFLALAAWHNKTDFWMSDTIQGIIAGSTAVSAIGLVGWVIQGIFGISKVAKAK